MVGWCSPRSCPLNTTKPSFMAPSFRSPQRSPVHTPKGMTVSLPLLHIHHLGDLFSELIPQSYSLDLALAIDSFPLAGSHYQLLPHNTEEKPKPEKIQKILALVLTSTLVGRFSLLSDCEVYLKARNFCLLSPPECKFHVVPPVHWHPYIESSCFPVLGWFFECLMSGVASPLSVWTLTLPWHLPCSHGGLLCLLLLLLSLPCLSLSDYYPHEYCHSQAYALCCWLYKDPVWSVFFMPTISTTSDALPDSQVFIALTFPLKPKVINSGICWTWPLH